MTTRLAAGIVAGVLLTPAVAAAQVKVTVVDASGAVIARARLSATCEGRSFAAVADDYGRIEVVGTPSSCLVAVEAPGFSTWRGTLGELVREPQVGLTVAAVDEHLQVRARAPWAALASASADRGDFSRLGWDADAVLRVARARAGVTLRDQALYVDGVPASSLPPAAAIHAMSINADPFSVLYSESDANIVEIESAMPDRQFRWSAGAAPAHLGGLNPLFRSSDPQRNASDVSVDLPVPRTPVMLSAFAWRQRYADPRPVITGAQLAPQPAMAAGTSTALTVQLAARWNTGVRTTLSVATASGRSSGINVGGIVEADAASSGSATSVDGRWLVEVNRARVRYRTTATFATADSTSTADSSEVGVQVLDDQIAGGAPVRSSRTVERRWALTQLADSDTGRWLAGWQIAGDAVRERLDPNAAGQWLFGSRAELHRAQNGAPATLIRIAGPIQQAVTQITASSFAQREWIGPVVTVRLGARADFQTADGITLSPRVSVRRMHGSLLVQSSAGVFRQNWSPTILMQASRFTAGSAVRQLVRADLLGRGEALVRPIHSAIDPGLTRPRSVIVANAVRQRWRNGEAGIEHRWTAATRRAGSLRVPVDDGWTDVLDSDRRLRRHQLHGRVQLAVRRIDVIANLEWMDSHDDGDGPLSFSASPLDSRDDWAPSAGVAPHHLSVVITPPVMWGVSTGLLLSARSTSPFDTRSGADPLDNALYIDRLGNTRNSGRGPAYQTVDAYAQRRVTVPLVRLRGQRLAVTVVAAADNLLGRRNISAIGAIRSSPTFAQPLRADPGRTLRVSVWLAK